MDTRVVITLVVILAIIVLVAVGLKASTPPTDYEQVGYVADVLESECGGESREGILGVVSVIKTRMEFTGKTAYEIVTEPYQFTKPHRVAKFDSFCYTQAVMLVKYPKAIKTKHGFTHFYAHKKCNPWWADELVDVKVIGNHTFGRLRDGKYCK